MRNPVVLGVTLGDVGGVGPEITLKALHAARWPASLKFVIVGSRAILKHRSKILGLPCPESWSPGSAMPSGNIVVWDPGPRTALSTRTGRPLLSSARAAAQWIRAAAGACVDGVLDGMVTAPICKESFNKAGIGFAGHTEFIAHLTGTKRYAMMLIGGGLHVTLATRHIPLADVPKKLTKKAILDAGRITAVAMPWLGQPDSVVGVCGLNPHAGDGGTIGKEEKKVIVPAIERLRSEGISVDGPLAADTAFFHALKGRYGAVVAMYHDQGLGPLKTLSFDTGINITLGLPIIRTSPDHGTAFDIAGKGTADCRSMVNAVRLAHKLARKPNPYRS